MKNTLPGLTPFWLLARTLVLSIFAVTAIPLVLSVEKVKLNDWIGFAGNVVGAIVTLAAATVAWFAVQRQIAAAKELAERQEVALLDLVATELLPFAQMYALAWRALDIAAAQDAPAMERGLGLVQTIVPFRQYFDEKMTEIAPFSQGLHPLKRWQLQEIERSGKLLGRYYGREDEDIRPVRPALDVMMARARFTLFASALEAFDARFVPVFADRTRSEFNEESDAEQLRPLVDQYEATGYVG
ncbi:hypothetical protein JQ574_22880 [Bradyrhizobium sp. AUGA SZCCT0158]|uniref:hypothetical protein n=1 Tax=Bradyrhizobium sp. AUGA SZCCT0158 TaxID=2807661 RepID=UPI001BAB7265|nr:hypothetical protein [Bradyrhizobium sp. AUGA SZCCT0158]MBR1198846.1 hypothetical protein [Bradyrhizobium sp. AUGA SZCCT0158]